MTQEEILQYNKMCAKFLGWKEQTDPLERWFGSFRDTDGRLHHNNSKEKLLFHEDWNLIMQVVEAILDVCSKADDMDAYYDMLDVWPQKAASVKAIHQFLIRHNA